MERKTHWEKVYRDKSPQAVSWYQADPRPSLEMIAQAGCAADAALIDVGGGASSLTEKLLLKGYQNLTVLDISANALAYAKNRIKNLKGIEGASVQWLESDVTEFQPSHSYDLWHDRAVFHFLTEDADRKKYITTLKQFLRKGGHLILATFALDGPKKCSGLEIVQYDSQKIIRELGDDFIVLSEHEETHMTPANNEQRFVFFHFVKK